MKFKIQNSRFNRSGSKIHLPSLTPIAQLPTSLFELRRTGWRTRNPISKDGWFCFSTFHFPLSTIWKTVVLLFILVFQISCSDPPLAPSPPRLQLDLGDRVVGVTRYCDFPPEARDKPKVGGYFDVNYEMLLSLEPDLIVLLVEHADARNRLEELGLETLPVNHSRVNGILESITTIADLSGVHDKGKVLRLALEDRINRIQKRFFAPSPSRPVAQSNPSVSASRSPSSGNPSPPRVLVAVGRLMDRRSGGEIFISGRDGFYDDLIVLAGGVNVYRKETLKFPAISDEGLIRLDPDVILEMVPDLAGETDRESLIDLWRSKPGIRAVREGRVHILGEDYVVVPGPRFVKLLEDMAEIINSLDPSTSSGQGIDNFSGKWK